jgi:hypothetical protein
MITLKGIALKYTHNCDEPERAKSQDSSSQEKAM